MKQYQRHVEIATKLANAGNYDLAVKNIESLIRSARSNKAKAYLNMRRREFILAAFVNAPTLQKTPTGFFDIAESQGYDLS
jgi:Holliday junction resolvase